MNQVLQLKDKLTELFRGIQEGDFNDYKNIPDKYTFWHLYALVFTASELEDGEELSRSLYQLFMRHAGYQIREKWKKKEKITVVFEMVSASEWSCDVLYRKLAEDPRFRVAILVDPILGEDRKEYVRSYEKAVSFFEKKGYHVWQGYDIRSERVLTFEELNGGVPDVMIHSTQYFSVLPPEHQLVNLPLRCINILIPYCMNVTNSMDGDHIIRDVFNADSANMMWRIYADSLQNLKNYETFQLLKGLNVRYSGHPKMDGMYRKKEFSGERLRKLWKIPEQADPYKMKKVIIASHYTVRHCGLIDMSTFEENMHFLLYLAQKYRDQVAFVFKPHPNLRSACVSTGLFKDYEEYDAYLARWEELPNAKVVEETTYLDLFASSDGMIMDCSSFIGEYIYAGRPCLFLTKPEQRMGPFGEKLIRAHYQVSGDDYYGIERFLEKVVIKGKDRMAAARKSIFEKTLDYRRANGCLAGEFIYKDMVKLVTGTTVQKMPENKLTG